MRRFLLTLSTIALALLFNACNRDTVVLDYTNAKGEVEQLSNLVFRFNKSLVADSLVNRWDSTAYISFKPAIPGHFRWTHTNELVFSPAGPLPPATSFSATLNRDLLQYTEYDRLAGGDNLTFSTPSLALDNVNVTWVKQGENSATAVPQVDLYFNYAVTPALLKDKMKLQVEGKTVSYAMQTLSGDSKISLRLLGIKAEDKDRDAELVLEKGLVPDGGSNATKESLERSYTIPSPFNLIVNDVSAEHDGLTGTVHIRTSQQVKMDDLASFISFDPAVKFDVEETDNGFMISSAAFDASRPYLLTLKKGLKGHIGGVLREQYDQNITFGELEPSISFANSKAVYLSAQGQKNIEVRITNVPTVKVIISKIYESNLLAAQHYGYYPQDRDDDEEDYYYEDNSGDYTLGDVVYDQEIDTRTLPEYGNSRLFKFNIDDHLPDFKGIYHIKIRSADDYWVRDSRFVSRSDIGLIAKEGKGKMIVFANSIQTAKAVSGANIFVYGSNNQVLGMATTNEEGIAEIEYQPSLLDGFRPAMVIAKTANDFNYLPFSNTRVNTSRFEVGGKRNNPSGLDAFIYPERDIYRPGEKVNFSVIVRDALWKTPGELPVKLKFLMPDGKELKSFRKTLNEQGSIEGSVDISPSAITGTYSLEVYTSNDVLLGSQNFSIEEFVPDRIKLTARLDKNVLGPGQTTNLSVHAVNFFGPPAANRNYESEIQIKQKSFNPRGFGSYVFGLANQNTFFDKKLREGKTDQSGNASEAFSVPAMYKNIGVLQADFYTTVFDETGRPVSRNTQATIYTQDVFFGIGTDGYWYYPLNQSVRFPVIALDKAGNVTSGQAHIQVIKHEYRTVLAKRGSYFRYNSQQEDKLIAEQTLTISGTSAHYSFVPRSPGNYELRIAVPGAGSYVSRSFYSYGYWGGNNESFEVNTEGNINIDLDKSSYNTGETVKALFKTPFSGRMLVTMETDHVISHQYVEVANRSASVDLPLTAEHLPNVYITATLIKPHDISDIPLTVAHGYKNVRVEERNRKIPVEIVAQKKVRSRTHQQVTVKAAPNSFITLAAVDNGVLQVTDFKTPDPYNYFYASKALGVTAYDLYPLLFPELQGKLSSTGGDGDIDMDRRVNPMPSKRIQLLSYWSGIQKTNGSGEAKFEFDVPQFSGEVRLMAVVYKNNSFGSGEAAMTVADPIVLSTALPRFLSPKDTVEVPVMITNTTEKATSASATLQVTGPLKVAGEASQRVDLPANSEASAVFKVVAAPSVAVGKVKVEVQGMGEKFVDETEISVRPASTLQVMTGGGTLKGGGAQRVTIGTNDFLPGSADYQLVVSRSPALELGDQLRYLVQYPYGCTEQTISAAFPQLYYNDLAGQLKAGATSTAGIANGNVQEAIRKIRFRQLYNGAVTLWDGGGNAHWWATVYAGHFLLEAQRAGFDVDKNLLSGILNYCNDRLKNKELVTYYYNRDQQRKIAPKEVAYSLYVLALAGRPNVSAMNYYKANADQLSLDSKYLLSAAYAVAGDKTRFRELLPGSFSGEESVAQTGGSFYSPIRDEAISLNALLEVDPGNSQVPLMVKHIATKLKQRSWYSTQECAFSFLALGKFYRKAAASTATAQVKVNGKVVGNFTGETLTLTEKQLGGTQVELTTGGSGALYYFWQARGISASGAYKEEDSYIKVRRRFFDRYGHVIDGQSFAQNDLVIVQLTVEKLYNGSVDNVVIADLLPAGFEIENPRTKEIPGMDWIKDADSPTALDVRDDRINIFDDLHKNKQVYYYAVRAVSPGLFHMGPVSADAMYNGEYHSYHGAGVVEIRK